MTTTVWPPAFPPTLVLFDEDLCQCEYVWATPGGSIAADLCEEWGIDINKLERFELQSVNGDQATYSSGGRSVVLQWNGWEEHCTTINWIEIDA